MKARTPFFKGITILSMVLTVSAPVLFAVGLIDYLLAISLMVTGGCCWWICSMVPRKFE
ncbi:MAG: hypothetical protein V4640_10850 [Verrucomicrobiota bacterium]